mgnify:CR=1 FL=1
MTPSSALLTIFSVCAEIPIIFSATESITLDINYQLQLPNTKFTRYGIDKKKNIALKEWFLVPGKLLNNEWECYSNKDLDDLYFPNSNLHINLTYPKNYTLTTDLDIDSCCASAHKFHGCKGIGFLYIKNPNDKYYLFLESYRS